MSKIKINVKVQDNDLTEVELGSMSNKQEMCVNLWVIKVMDNIVVDNNFQLTTPLALCLLINYVPR